MKLTVICLTYNHEPYIERALRGFVNQVTDFDFEVIVGDDASTDRTADLIRRYADLYPDRIKPVLREKNLGVIENERDVYQQIKSEYIIFCEGDDYWCNDLFLSQGVAFLDAHQDCVMYCGNTLWNFVEEGRQHLGQKNLKSGWFSVKDDVYLHTSARIMRRQKKMPAADLYMFYYFLTQGRCYYHNDLVSVYTITGKGDWSGFSREKQDQLNKGAYLALNEFLAYQYDDVLTKHIIKNKRYRQILALVKKIIGPQQFWEHYRERCGLSDAEIIWVEEGQ